MAAPCRSGSRAGALLTLLAASSILSAACGKRGDPRPPLPKTPGPISGLTLSQRGDTLGVELLAPKLTTAGQRLPVLEIELLRAQVDGDLAKVAARTRRRVAPGELFREAGPLPASGTTVRVAARALSKGQASALTAISALTVWPQLPAPIGFAARVAGAGVELSWTMPALPEPPPLPSPAPIPAGEPAASLAGPKPPPDAPIQRAAPGSAGAPPATQGTTAAPSIAPPAITQPAITAAGTPTPAATTPPPPPPPTPGVLVYRRDDTGEYGLPLTAAVIEQAPWIDTGPAVGQRYCYVARVAVSVEPFIESAESEEQCVEFRDIAPPPTPVGLAALSREGAVELSWSPVTSPDATLIRLRRAEVDRPSELLAELPPGTTSFRDATVASGATYVYTLAAVDQAGNESPSSSPARVRVP
jgi:hypothetical protein